MLLGRCGQVALLVLVDAGLFHCSPQPFVLCPLAATVATRVAPPMLAGERQAPGTAIPTSCSLWVSACGRAGKGMLRLSHVLHRCGSLLPRPCPASGTTSVAGTVEATMTGEPLSTWQGAQLRNGRRALSPGTLQLATAPAGGLPGALLLVLSPV